MSPDIRLQRWFEAPPDVVFDAYPDPDASSEDWKVLAQLVQIPQQGKRKLVRWASEEAKRFLESARSDSDPLYAAYVLV